jgi:hypothetical protein
MMAEKRKVWDRLRRTLIATFQSYFSLVCVLKRSIDRPGHHGAPGSKPFGSRPSG